MDPIAKMGGFNGFFGPSWYGYAEASPLRWADPWGLSPSDWWDPRFYHDFWGDSFDAVGDFWNNYWDMREAWLKGADKYFHCKANCMASRRGFGGLDTAEFISESREWVDEHIKGDPPSACNEDRAANKYGQRHSRDNDRFQSPLTPNWEKDMKCQFVCLPFAPPTLDPRW